MEILTSWQNLTSDLDLKKLQVPKISEMECRKVPVFYHRFTKDWSCMVDTWSFKGLAGKFTGTSPISDEKIKVSGEDFELNQSGTILNSFLASTRIVAVQSSQGWLVASES